MLNKIAKEWSNAKIIATMLSISGVLVLIGLMVRMVLGGSRTESNSNKIAATIFPVYSLVQELAPEEVEVELVLEPGLSPHTFEMTPSTARMVADAQIVFAIGQGLDQWVYDGVGESKVIDLSEGISLLDGHGHDEEEDEEEDSHDGEEFMDPHYWLSVPNAMLMSLQIKTALTTLYPDKISEIEQNYEKLTDKLLGLDKEVRLSVEQMENKKLATFHQSWQYFAKDYGLEIVAVYEESGGDTVTPGELAEFMSQIRNEQVMAAFGEPQFDSQQIAVAARDAGVSFSVLDPLGGVEGRNSYEELIRYNLERMVNAQSRP